jgi:archaellum biogenesis protein FlaJ (TadC family)
MGSLIRDKQIKFYEREIESLLNEYELFFKSNIDDLKNAKELFLGIYLGTDSIRGTFKAGAVVFLNFTIQLPLILYVPK